MLLTATAEAAASSPKISLGRRWLTPFGRGGRFGYSAKAQARQQIGRALDRQVLEHGVFFCPTQKSFRRPLDCSGLGPPNWRRQRHEAVAI